MTAADAAPEKFVPLTPSFEIGSRPGCDFRIDSDQVTDMHAVVETADGRSRLRDRGSRTGTLVNNRPVAEVTLARGDWISIGPTMFQFLGDRLAVYPRGHQYRVVGIGLRRVVPVAPEARGGAPGELTLIDDVSVAVEPGQFTAIIGPSGSGKSTLLNALSARVPADAGVVTVNGRDLIEQFDALKRSMVLVPQRETIHEALPVRAVLTHTARLRMPAGTSELALTREVTRVLDVVGLPEENRGTAFRALSGGQKKRVCLANELIGNPEIVFLDEVTSGLDEEADGRMMELFRRLADGGKTVIGITHNLANVERYCHRVIVLARGGRFVFAGTPAETVAYFGVPRLGDVYRTLEEADPPGRPPAPADRAAKAQAWRDAYEATPARAAEVAALRAPAPPAKARPADAPAGPAAEETRAARVRSQTLALARRYADLQLADRANLLAMAGTSLLVAALLVIVFGGVGVQPADLTGTDAAKAIQRAADATMLMFLIAFSCMWFGCTNAAKEVVKEADIYRMERNHSLDPLAYYLSKLLVLSVISVAQAALLYVPVKAICLPPGDALYQALTLGGLTVLGVMVGLVISCAARTVDAAATLVPIVMIPQFVLAGALVAVSGLSKFLATFSVLYWGHKAVIASQPTFLLDRMTDAPGWTSAHAVLLVHAAAYAGGALLLLRLRDSGRTSADLVNLARVALRDPNGPAARALRAAKNRLGAKAAEGT